MLVRGEITLKVVLLCGGKGLRMKELTEEIPKPLALVGDKPLLWHIMKIYYSFGFDDFIVLLGYKGYKIKEYFVNYPWYSNNFILDCTKNNITLLKNCEKWKITFIDTGENVMTGSRIKKVRDLIGEEDFMMTYGDGLADINLIELKKYHEEKGTIATVTGITKNSRYGVIKEKNGIAISFDEKSSTKNIINGGFFVFKKEIFDYLDNGDQCILEREPLVNLTNSNQLAVYMHRGFWTAVDTYKELIELNDIWYSNECKWKVW